MGSTAAVRGHPGRMAGALVDLRRRGRRVLSRAGRSLHGGPWWLWLCVGVAVAVSLAAWATSLPSPAVTASTPQVAVPVTAVPATTVPPSPHPMVDVAAPSRLLGPWVLRSRSLVLATLADQGLATVHRPGQDPTIVFRGGGSIPPAIRQQGWVHVGDPGAWHGYLVDAYQGPPGATSKMYEVTAPDGSTHQYVHPLTPGEALNNSFAAISTDGQWMVSGEWGQMIRLLVFPTPLVNRRVPATQRSLPLAGSIRLARPVRDVQGCTFVSRVQLLCATDDPGRDLWPTPHQLIQVTLPRPLAGHDVTAQVTSLGELPMASSCTGTYEVEGIDYQASTGDLRVEVKPPGRCGLSIAVYDYRQPAGS